MRVKRRKGDHQPFRSLSPVEFVFIFLLLLVQSCNGFEEVRCKTIDIRNRPRMWTGVDSTGSKASGLDPNCTVLEGSFLMSMVQQPKDLNRSLVNSDFPRFENIREITGSVLFFQVTGLTSLGWIFPNLRVIGGQNLIQHYSLIVYQNGDLEELGLKNLRLIRNGGVRIAENPKLCNAKSIEWNRLQNGPINDVLVDDAAEITISEGKIEPCQSCSVTNPERCMLSTVGGYACWGKNNCQLNCPFDKINLTNNGSRPGCDDETWSACHVECVAGCTLPNDPSACYACAHISHMGKCIPKCPDDLFSFMNRRCIEQRACETLKPRIHNGQEEHWKAVDGKCHYSCPEGFEDDPANPKTCRRCGTECIRKCPGNITIDSLSKARQLERCNVIEGSLTIEMRIGMDSVPAQELTQAFSRVQTIDGYLLIRYSPSFVNLFMFKSLTNITGRILYRDKYSVAVYENPNLQKLFPPNPKFDVAAGYLQFQNNRMLCFDHIEELMKSLGRLKEMDEFDQSRNSNGDKAICSESTFKVDVGDVTSTSFVLKWLPYNTTDMDYRKFLGYEIMYKEVEKIDKELSIDDDRSACSDSWNSHFKEVKTSVTEGGHVLTDLRDKMGKDETMEILEGSERKTSKVQPVEVMIANEYIKPNTIYAFYVTTSMVRHDGARNAVSEIGFVETLFGTPDPPKLTKAEQRGTDKIYVEWDPPLRPNGQITHYMVTFRPNTPNLPNTKMSVCPDDVNTRVSEGLEEESEASPTPSQSIFLSTVAPDTCSAKGCCSCPADAKTASLERQELSDFENALQDVVFIQHCDYHWDPLRCDNQVLPESPKAPSEGGGKTRRSVGWEKRRRLIYRSPHLIRNTFAAADFDSDEKSGFRRLKRSLPSAPEDKEHEEEESEDDSETTERVRQLLTQIQENEKKEAPKQQNVTSTNITLTGLNHFTSYFISISACQNISAPKHSCSQRKAWKNVRTDPILDADVVDNSTIVVKIINATSDVKVTWETPKKPNGAIFGYRVKAINIATKATPVPKCAPNIEGWTPEEDGVILEGLNDGDYRIEVRTVSMLGLSSASARDELLRIYTPGWWTVERILGTLVGLILFVCLAMGVAYYFIKRYYGVKVIEYATQLISANPEYLSQNDVYKADEWELPRSHLVIEEEIGKGTFGKVYRGRGQSPVDGQEVTSVRGDKFGVCAIKTVAESANSAERIHFLLEASVMKKFDSSFIVKLYGVVSDGQPVLVVMEMMEKGNLRDYLRSRRPGAEENVHNLPMPTEAEMFKWAAQIADGMAYLESQRFCHRDVAARNCMVHADETVKIGDFGMTRDLCYSEYYKPAGRRMMPVRWMAPESLVDGRHDMKSDVWSYGVVLYEMWTLGQQPYQGFANEQILEHVARKKHILEQPDECPDHWYTLMKECWKYAPKDRPNFYQIVMYFMNEDGIDLGDNFRKLSFVAQHPDLEMIEEEEPAYVPEGHGMHSLEIANEEDNYVMKTKKKRGADGPIGRGEMDALASDHNGIAEHEV